MTLGAVRPAFAADAAFTQFIASLWPEAQAAGVSRATFDAETQGLEPDYKLPDLMLPGRPATGAPSQAEFVQVPADYVKEASIARLAAEGQKLMQKHRAALDEIESASAFLQASCWRSGAARRITAATGCPTTRCAWWRRRPMSAAARTSIAASSFWR
jgi:membrane-bound lytic murein transglycosylase B